MAARNERPPMRFQKQMAASKLLIIDELGFVPLSKTRAELLFELILQLYTDRSTQYCSHDYQKLLRPHGFQVSMSGTVNCFDRAAMETFFKTIKAESIWRRSWQTRREAEIASFEYINGFYNPRRRRSALGWKGPLAFQAKAA